MEWILSGYCRNQDQSRTVMVEQEGSQWYYDCDYPDCPYCGDCTIASQIKAIQEERK